MAKSLADELSADKLVFKNCKSVQWEFNQITLLQQSPCVPFGVNTKNVFRDDQLYAQAVDRRYYAE